MGPRTPLVRASGPIPLAPALEILAECAGALHVAYTREGPDGRPLRLLHRDLKPSNLQLTAAGEVKILDFGIARAEFASREAETRSVFFGSVGYIAPERFDDIEGPAGDVYSLGVVFWELLVGEVFGKTSSHQGRHEAKVAQGLDRLRGSLDDEGAIEFVSRMMSFEPDQRPSARDVEKLAREMQRRVGGEWLRDWCERTVPPLLGRAVDLDRDELSGAVLSESGAAASTMDLAAVAPAASPNAAAPEATGTVFVRDERPARQPAAAPVSPPAVQVASVPPPPEPAPKPVPPAPVAAPEPSDVEASNSRSRWMVVAVVAGLGVAALAAVSLTSAGAWWWMQPAGDTGDLPVADVVDSDAGDPPVEPAVVDADTAAATDTAIPGDPPEDTAKPAVEPEKPPEPPKEEAPRPKKKPKPPPEEERSGPNTVVSADPTSAVVRLSGSARSVIFRSSGRGWTAGSIPAGLYEIWADFGDGELQLSGKLRVNAGSTYTVNCEAGKGCTAY